MAVLRKLQIKVALNEKKLLVGGFCPKEKYLNCSWATSWNLHHFMQYCSTCKLSLCFVKKKLKCSHAAIVRQFPIHIFHPTSHIICGRKFSLWGINSITCDIFVCREKEKRKKGFVFFEHYNFDFPFSFFNIYDTLLQIDFF